MRRKKNLEEKLLSVSDILLIPDCQEKDIRKAISNKEYIDFPKLFGNNNPVHLEIGCGKGRFSIDSATLNPNINYVAMEISANVIYEGCAAAQKKALKNLKFINLDAKLILKYFPPSSIDKIYLNFSCPYPKKPYANRRLTNPKFLEYYDEILKPFGKIQQKTDNVGLYEYSLLSYKECGYEIEFSTNDLHKDRPEGNIMTEYEKTFSEKGFTINRCVCKF